MTTEPDDARCPSCGAAASSRYCPHCGARTGWTDLVPPAAGEPPTVQVPPASPAPPLASGVPGPAVASGIVPPVDADAPTLPSMPAVVRPVPPRAVPEMFSTEFLPVRAAQAWSQADPGAAPASQAPGLFPGWTGMHPAVPVAGAAQLAPRPERRRKAIYAVLGIAAATVIVVLAALLIAPNWRGTGGTADKVEPGPVGGLSGSASATVTSTSSAGSTNTTPGSAGGVPPVLTVTVTASTGSAPTATGSTGPATTPSTSTATPTPKPSPKPTPTAPAPPLGVPQRDITCSSGYIVQLASELDEPRFKARVATLKSAGQLPAGALAADSARSCRIFTSQVNTLVLYSGPFPSKYDGCAARLAGPADAYIKGGNADSAGEYVSCLCPAAVASLPRYSAANQQGVWIGELQRVLGNRLGIDVSDLAGNWGRFTAGTRAAVQRFQQAAKLPANGVVDARTWTALQSAGC